MMLRTLRVPFNMETALFVIYGTIFVAASMKEKPTPPLRTLATAGQIQEHQLEDRSTAVAYYSNLGEGHCVDSDNRRPFHFWVREDSKAICEEDCTLDAQCVAYEYGQLETRSYYSKCSRTSNKCTLLDVFFDKKIKKYYTKTLCQLIYLTKPNGVPNRRNQYYATYAYQAGDGGNSVSQAFRSAYSKRNAHHNAYKKQRCYKKRAVSCATRSKSSACNRIRDRKTCLTTTESRSPWTSSPCGWCPTGPGKYGCNGNNQVKTNNICEPSEWLEDNKVSDIETCMTGIAFECTTNKVGLKSIHGKYVVENYPTVNQEATDQRGDQETFTVEYMGPSKIALLSYNKRYIVAENGPGYEINAAKRGVFTEGVIFTVEQQEGGTFALKTAFDRYVTAQSDGTLKGLYTSAGEWERFTPECISA